MQPLLRAILGVLGHVAWWHHRQLSTVTGLAWKRPHTTFLTAPMTRAFRQPFSTAAWLIAKDFGHDGVTDRRLHKQLFLYEQLLLHPSGPPLLDITPLNNKLVRWNRNSFGCLYQKSLTWRMMTVDLCVNSIRRHCHRKAAQTCHFHPTHFSFIYLITSSHFHWMVGRFLSKRNFLMRLLIESHSGAHQCESMWINFFTPVRLFTLSPRLRQQ